MVRERCLSEGLLDKTGSWARLWGTPLLVWTDVEIQPDWIWVEKASWVTGMHFSLSAVPGCSWSCHCEFPHGWATVWTHTLKQTLSPLSLLCQGASPQHRKGTRTVSFVQNNLLQRQDGRKKGNQFAARALRLRKDFWEAQWGGKDFWRWPSHCLDRFSICIAHSHLAMYFLSLPPPPPKAPSHAPATRSDAAWKCKLLH